VADSEEGDEYHEHPIYSSVKRLRIRGDLFDALLADGASRCRLSAPRL
jgi:hypothetical protein